MAFYLRKSITVGPFRFNLSKSGIGLSVGVRGLRVGTGPRGHYIHAGASGFYYRAAIGRAGDRTPPASVRPHQAAVSFVDNVAMEEIESGDVLAMTDVRFQDVIDEINRKCRQVRLSSILGWSVGGIAAWIALGVANAVPLLAILPAYAIGKWLDGHRRTTVLFYNLEPPVLAAYRELIAAFEQMSRSAKSWHISAAGRVADLHTWKRHAGADKLIKSTVISPKLTLPTEIKCNLDPPHLNVGKQGLYFFPDFVLVIESGSAGAIPYAELGLDARGVLHIENGAVPMDAQVVDHTWQHPNKKGGPDRRFAFNKRLPICRYEELHLTSHSGLNELVTFSRAGGASAFAVAARSLSKFGAQEESAAPLMPGDARPSPARSSSGWSRRAAIIAIGLGIACVIALGARGPSPSRSPAVAKVERPTVVPPPAATAPTPAKNAQSRGPNTRTGLDEWRVSVSPNLTIVAPQPHPSPSKGASTKPSASVDVCKSHCSTQLKLAVKLEQPFNRTACYAECVATQPRRTKTPQ
ncbi:DUF4236 domain-containing protein [Hyphomicrobium sp. CS1BSMeth3]|uniref:DUF4236 domain-containing protein n=1 Tax=Hyphomicrobium sp. CS1BSMeth3 TaxID=1892844 RepID=UPI0009312A3D|nr:DUF4236 domain-containing protein [Hyphomicrobium sp. CS1BSMeth3]